MPFKPSTMTILLVLLSAICLMESSQASLRIKYIKYGYSYRSSSIPSRSRTDDYSYSYRYPPINNCHLQLRGGAARNGGGPIELNPGYDHYVGTSSSPSSNEHEVWLQQQQTFQQQQQQQQHQSSFASFRFPQKETSLKEKIQNYFVSLHQISPFLLWTTLACMAVFGMWQIPRFTRGPPNSILSRYFVNSHDNTRKTLGLSLVLASVSHISPYHLLVNLLSFSHLGPSVCTLLQQQQQQQASSSLFRSGQQQWKSKLWPLLLSSAVFSNAFFLLSQGRRRGAASSLGLSGVTMTLLAIQALATPSRQFRIVLGIFPVSLQAKHFLQILIGVSLLGCLSSGSSGSASSNIAHGAHLGGLVYGMLYYELVIVGLTPQRLLKKIQKSLLGRR
jgi:membrane associated rhomboid family serine protease